MNKLFILFGTLMILTASVGAQMTPVVAPQLPSKVYFAGERVPLENFDVRERLDRELIINCYMQSKTLLILKLANRYESLIKAILKSNNIPEDMFYLCVAESGLANVDSKAGASGFWQFMPATGRSFGLEINSYVDERYNWKKSTVAACQYLRDAYAKFGGWTEAAASYNMGMGGLSSRINQQQKGTYYDLILPEETERYVFRIIALKLILENPKAYGYQLQSSDLYYPIPVQTAIVSTGISDLISWSLEHGTSLRLVRELNPWLLTTFLKNTAGKTYEIDLPKSASK